MIKETAISIIFYYLEKGFPRYLFLKYGVYGQEHWDFVKGRTESGESIEDTGRREAFEEASIKDFKIVSGFREESKYQYKKNTGEDTDKTVVYLLSELSKEKSREIKISSEHEDFKWVGYGEAKKLLEFKNQKEILEKVNSFIKSIKC